MEQERPWHEYEWVCVVWWWGGDLWLHWCVCMGVRGVYMGMEEISGIVCQCSCPERETQRNRYTVQVFHMGEKLREKERRTSFLSEWLSVCVCVYTKYRVWDKAVCTKPELWFKAIDKIIVNLRPGQCFIPVFVNDGGGKWQSKLCDTPRRKDRHYKQEKKHSWTNVLASRNKSGHGHRRTLLLEKSSVVEQLWVERREKGPLCAGGGSPIDALTILSRLIHKQGQWTLMSSCRFYDDTQLTRDQCSQDQRAMQNFFS